MAAPGYNLTSSSLAQLEEAAAAKGPCPAAGLVVPGFEGLDLGPAILRQELAELYRDRQQLHAELFEAAQVQRKLAGPRWLCRDRFEIATEVFPAGHLSGDFISVFDAGERIALALGDIAGKGIAAALWVAHLVSLVRVLAGSGFDPSHAVGAINYEFSHSRLGPPVTSLFFAYLDARSSELAFCNAGHPLPIVLHANGDTSVLEKGGPVLGAVRNAAFEVGHVALAAGDTLLAFSDGLVECPNRAGEEFGVERVAASARAAAHLPPRQVVFSVLGAVQDFSANQPRQDDITVLVVRHHRRPAA